MRECYCFSEPRFSALEGWLKRKKLEIGCEENNSKDGGNHKFRRQYTQSTHIYLKKFFAVYLKFEFK